MHRRVSVTEVLQGSIYWHSGLPNISNAKINHKYHSQHISPFIYPSIFFLTAILIVCSTIYKNNHSETTSCNNIINLAQWNPHWQCFILNPKECGKAALQLLDLIILGNKDKVNSEFPLSDMKYDYDCGGMDFINLIGLPIKHYPYTPQNGWTILNSQECGTPPYKPDWDTLIYNDQKWKPLNNGKLSYTEMCMIEGNQYIARSFVVQGFVRISDGLRVVVAGAHYSHDHRGNK